MYKICGIFTGTMIGFLLEETLVMFSDSGKPGLKTIRYVAGIVTTFLLYGRIKKAFFPNKISFIS